MAERKREVGTGAGATGRAAWPDPIRPAPTLADFAAGGDRRAAFLAYVKTELPRDLRDTAMTALFSALPLPAASALGAWLGRRVGRTLIAADGMRWRRIRANLALIRPDMPSSEYAAVTLRFHEVFGRLLAEMPHLTRLADHMRVEGEELLASTPERPLILVGLHTGNWEVAAAKAFARGMPLASIAIPMPQRARHRILTRLRSRAGTILIDPSPQGLRQTMEILKRGGRQVIFCDETDAAGRLRAPFFGRAPDPQANIATATRIARKINARLVVFHVRRDEGLSMLCTVGPEIHLAPAAPGVDPLPGDLLAVNAAIEPIVRANVDQWYWLDSTIR